MQVHLSTPMDLNIQTILAGLILAGILWIAKSVSDQGKAIAILKTVLVGSEGGEGIESEVKELRKRSHLHGDSLHALTGKHDLLEQRVGTIERRHHVRREEDRA
jgi:hypothetical protein